MMPRMTGSPNDGMKESATNSEDFASLFRYTVFSDTSAKDRV